MENKNNLPNRCLARGLCLTAASAFALIAACGGGGGGSISIDVQGNSTPTNTNTPVPTATNTATVSPTPAATAPPTQTPTPQPYAVTHSFGARNDGYGPTAGLISDGMANFYGTTYSGGRALSGTVYKMTGAGVVSVVYPLNLSNPGANPEHSLVSDGTGNFYGSTKYAGSVPYGGSIFKITDAGSVTLLHTFSVSDGTFSAGPLLGDGAGNFYGTTQGGGANQKGTVFKITAAGAFTSLHSFEGTDGNLPSSGLVTDGLGNFYGTTFAGGAKNQGAVYKITDAGVVTVLHSFSYDTPTNGSQPEGRLLRYDLGNFYGITSNGGANNTGTAYKISSTGEFTLLHSFGADGDGLYPKASLVSDGAGNIYGTTSKGGANNEGTVFKMTEAGVVTILHSFGNGLDGKVPLAELVFDGAGSLYGTTSEGGVFSKGTVFRIPAQ